MNKEQLPELGIIEGFYGRPWSPEDRAWAVRNLAKEGIRFFLYAPKGDPGLRKRWREPYPPESERVVRQALEDCHAAGVEFGVGLSPYEIYRSFDAQDRRDLRARLELLDSWGIDRLAILFDDMQGDLPGLARSQVEILHFVREHSRAKRLTFCPTYYSLDPLLDQVFGPRPEGYLEELGSALDPSIGVFWTGENICSENYTAAHLGWISGVLGRKIDLWDNYPVNDGVRMCRFLHLRPFRGRGVELAPYLASHGVNPMNQARLSAAPLRSLMKAYEGLSPSFRETASGIYPESLVALLERDLSRFQDQGLDALGAVEKAELEDEYGRIIHPAAHEVVDWLRDGTRATREEVLTQ